MSFGRRVLNEGKVRMRLSNRVKGEWVLTAVFLGRSARAVCGGNGIPITRHLARRAHLTGRDEKHVRNVFFVVLCSTNFRVFAQTSDENKFREV